MGDDERKTDDRHEWLKQRVASAFKGMKADRLDKGFGKGLEQLGEEGVVQVFWPRFGAREPILGAVGELQLVIRNQLFISCLSAIH